MEVGELANVPGKEGSLYTADDDATFFNIICILETMHQIKVCLQTDFFVI